jgi:sigma-B regulation protein RsbU (phosphoserine phosphatase)
MALALSAAGIHVQAAFDPSVALEAVQRSLRDELETTEMSISMCYAVIDTRAGELRYANAGHPHAFALTAQGQCVRLGAVAPPLGWCEDSIEESVMTWKPGHRLVFFTDGVADARNAAGERLTEDAVLATLSRMSGGESPDDVLQQLFTQLEAHVGRTPLRDDCTVVVVDRP